MCVIEEWTLRNRQPIRSTLSMSPERVAAVLADVEVNVQARREALPSLELRRLLETEAYLKVPPFACLFPVEDLQPLSCSGLDERAWHDELLRIARRHASDNGIDWTRTGGLTVSERWIDEAMDESWWDEAGDGDWYVQGERHADMTLPADMAKLVDEEFPRMISMDDGHM
jgi:hypothetical protein